ncbi:MAG: DUF1223 domain-containing protein [Kofleriaceae bacterium]
MRLAPLAVLAAGVLAACSYAEGEPKPRGPVVIELFTSQGCSSCPPADRLLSKLARDSTEDRPIAPLSFHVDYWDDLGWPDPFAKPAWTERQRGYARALGDRSIYTPQLVVGGAKGVVGSNSLSVTTALAAAKQPELLPTKSVWSAAHLEVEVTAPADADVWIAIWEDNTTTKVTRGENAGETLAHDRVVRHLERMAIAGKKSTTTIKLDPRWRTTGAVAFAQRTDRTIVSSAFLRR